MKIQRIDTYQDPRFRDAVLKQHGAFLIDDTYSCEFRITGSDSAQVFYHDNSNIEEIIDEFRFYAEHITVFYDNQGKLLKSFSPVIPFEISLRDIQPSQFYVDEEKAAAVSSFVRSGRDVVVPLTVHPENGRYISMDGHTRMYVAMQMGIEQVMGYTASCSECIYDFAKEAEGRGIYSVYDMRKISHEEYKVKWHQFCEEYFAQNP